MEFIVFMVIMIVYGVMSTAMSGGTRHVHKTLHKHRRKPDIFELLDRDNPDNGIKEPNESDSLWMKDSTPISLGDQFMSAKEKQAYMQSAEWYALKQQRLSIANYTCECEGCSTTTNLSLHHQVYDRLGAEHITDLRIVCQTHHNAIHSITGFDRTSSHPITVLDNK